MALRSGDRPQEEAPVSDAVRVKECNPQAAVRQSLFSGRAAPRAPDLCAASTVAGPRSGRCELETGEQRANRLHDSAQPEILSTAHTPAAVGVVR